LCNPINVNGLFMTDEQRQLAYRMQLFREVVLQGSFTQAGEVLALTKSSLSQHVRQLEKHLGAQLLVRSTRRISLTEAGRLFFARCQTISTMLVASCDEIAQLNQRPSGPIRITAPSALASSIMVPALARLTDQFPELEPHLHIDDVVVSVAALGIDLALRVGSLPDSTLRARQIGQLQGLLVAAPSYLTVAPAVQCLEDLLNHSWIATHWQASNKGLRLDDRTGAQHHLQWNPKFRVNSAAIACELAIHGMGMALLPDLLVSQALKTGQLTLVQGGWHEPPQPISILHNYHQSMPLAVACLRTYVTAQVEELCAVTRHQIMLLSDA
jgi:DNA-binding transcriptional LysR family regulator